MQDSTTNIKHSELQDILAFLMEFANSLMISGSQTSRIIRNIERLSNTFGCRADVIILPQTIIMTLSSIQDTRTSITAVKKFSPMESDFTMLSNMRILSWETYKNNLSLTECKKRLCDVTKKKHLPLYTKALIVSCGNAAFCQLFGGLYSIPIVFFATLLGFSARAFLMKRGISILLAFMVAAFISAITAGFLSKYFATEVDVAISTSVLYLIPGVPLLNSFIDLFDRHVLAGISRLVNASQLILAMTMGLLTAILILGHSII